MFGKNKKSKEKGLPDLPSGFNASPTMNDYTGSNYNNQMNTFEDEEFHGLPSFPDSPMSKGFSQSAIKDAVESPEMRENSESLTEFNDEQDFEMPDLPRDNNKVREFSEWKPKPAQMKMQPLSHQKEENPNRPIFIKLDKFKETKESLEIIKQKVDEMDNILKIIKDIKNKEDEEITEWEKEIEKVKARINFVNSNIFENAY